MAEGAATSSLKSRSAAAAPPDAVSSSSGCAASLLEAAASSSIDPAWGGEGLEPAQPILAATNHRTRPHPFHHPPIVLARTYRTHAFEESSFGLRVADRLVECRASLDGATGPPYCDVVFAGLARAAQAGD